MKTKLDPFALYWASFNRFSLRLPGACVQDCPHSGACDEDVAYWVNRVALSDVDLTGRERCTPDAIREELSEYGAWDAEELADDDANRRRLLWIAAGNVADDDAPDCSEPLVRSGEVGPFAVLGI